MQCDVGRRFAAAALGWGSSLGGRRSARIHHGSADQTNGRFYGGLCMALAR
jgi:hypothetical protein